MRANSSSKSFLAMVILVTAGGFLLWMGVLALLWLILAAQGLPTALWEMIGALSTALAATAVFSAGLVAYRELSEIAVSRHIEIANQLFAELNSEHNIEARRWVFQNLNPDPQEGTKTMGEEGRAAIKQVLNSLDHVAFLTQSGWIPEDLVMPWMHPMVAKSWHKLEPYVEYERNRRREPYYYANVSKLAARCNVWRKAHLAETEIVWVEDAL